MSARSFTDSTRSLGADLWRAEGGGEAVLEKERETGRKYGHPDPEITDLERRHREGYARRPVERREFSGWEDEQVWAD